MLVPAWETLGIPEVLTERTLLEKVKILILTKVIPESFGWQSRCSLALLYHCNKVSYGFSFIFLYQTQSQRSRAKGFAALPMFVLRGLLVKSPQAMSWLHVPAVRDKILPFGPALPHPNSTRATLSFSCSPKMFSRFQDKLNNCRSPRRLRALIINSPKNKGTWGLDYKPSLDSYLPFSFAFFSVKCALFLCLPWAYCYNFPHPKRCTATRHECFHGDTEEKPPELNKLTRGDSSPQIRLKPLCFSGIIWSSPFAFFNLMGDRIWW